MSLGISHGSNKRVSTGHALGDSGWTPADEPYPSWSGGAWEVDRLEEDQGRRRLSRSPWDLIGSPPQPPCHELRPPLVSLMEKTPTGCVPSLHARNGEGPAPADTRERVGGGERRAAAGHVDGTTDAVRSPGPSRAGAPQVVRALGRRCVPSDARAHQPTAANGGSSTPGIPHPLVRTVQGE